MSQKIWSYPLFISDIFEKATGRGKINPAAVLVLHIFSFQFPVLLKCCSLLVSPITYNR